MTSGARMHTSTLLPTPEVESFDGDDVGIGFESTNPELSAWSENEYEWKQGMALISRQESSSSSKATCFDFIKFDPEQQVHQATGGQEHLHAVFLSKGLAPPPLSPFPTRPSTGVTRKPEIIGEVGSHVRSRSAGAHRPVHRRIHSATAQANERINMRQRRDGSPNRFQEGELPDKDGAVQPPRMLSQNRISTGRATELSGVTGRAIEGTIPAVQMVRTARPQTSQGFSRDPSSQWSMGGWREENELSVGHRGVGWSRRLEALSRPQTALAAVHASPR